MIKTEFKPYVYLIGWSKNKVYYFGAQFGKKANPSNLWISYFTSSKQVKIYCESNGEPDIIKICKTFSSAEECKCYEHNKLKIYIKKDNFLNKSCNFGDNSFSDTGFATVRDKITGECLKIHSSLLKDSDRYESVIVGKVAVYDKTGKSFMVDKTDERLQSKELLPVNKNKVSVRDTSGNIFQVDKHDPNIGILYFYVNTQTGKIWITNDIKNKYILPEEFEFYSNLGWRKGHIQKYPNRDYSIEKNSQLETCWISNNLLHKTKKIKLKDINNYISSGWYRGRLYK